MDLFDRMPMDGEKESEGFEKTDNDVAALRALDSYDHAAAPQKASAFESEFDAEFDEDDYWETYSPPLPDAQSDDCSTTRPAQRKKNWRRRAAVTAVVLLVAVVGGALLVAEPWVPAVADAYVTPEPQVVAAPVTLKVGDSFRIDVERGENEIIDAVISSESDIISVDGDHVLALGQWEDVMVTVITREAEVPAEIETPFTPLGLDLTKPYHRTRDWLRNLLGIERIEPPRSDLRVLNIYEMTFRVEGFPTQKIDTPINLYTSDEYVIRIALLHEGEEVEFEQTSEILTVASVTDDSGARSFSATSGSATGTGRLTVMIGFYKDGVFVPTRAVEYDVEVLARPEVGKEPAVFAMGNHNGRVPLAEPEEESDTADESGD